MYKEFYVYPPPHLGPSSRWPGSREGAPGSGQLRVLTSVALHLQLFNTVVPTLTISSSFYSVLEKLNLDLLPSRPAVPKYVQVTTTTSSWTEFPVTGYGL